MHILIQNIIHNTRVLLIYCLVLAQLNLSSGACLMTFADNIFPYKNCISTTFPFVPAHDQVITHQDTINNVCMYICILCPSTYVHIFIYVHYVSKNVYSTYVFVKIHPYIRMYVCTHVYSVDMPKTYVCTYVLCMCINIRKYLCYVCLHTHMEDC